MFHNLEDFFGGKIALNKVDWARLSPKLQEAEAELDFILKAQKEREHITE